MTSLKTSQSDIMNKLSNNKEYMEDKTFSLYEKYDITNMAKLLNSDCIDSEWKGRMKKYRQHSKNGSVKVNYTRNQIGRLEIKASDLKDKETLTCISFMKGLCKSALCSKYYYDLDVVNSHPVMLLKILKDYEIDCPVIEKYVNCRDEIIAEYTKSTPLVRDDIKQLLCLICYGGSVDKFMNEHKIDIIPPFFKDFETELRSVRTELLNKPELFKYKMKAHDEKGSDYHNIDGTALSYFLQTHECNVLMIMYKHITEHINDKMIGSLIHDGMHIDKQMTDDYGEDALIDKLEKVIKHKSGFDLKLKIKPFQDIDELEKIICVDNDKEAGDHMSDLLKNDYIICNERTFMRINNVWTENDKTIKKHLVKEIGNTDIYIQTEDAKGNPVLKQHSKMCKGSKDIMNFVTPTEDDDFVDKLWTSNLYKLCFKNGYYDFKKGMLVPYDPETHTTIKINRDFKAASPEMKKEVYDKIFNPIFNNDNEMMNCWLNYIARGLAGHVEDKNWAVGIGERDCGKGVLVGLLENAFGLYCRSTNSENFLYKSSGGDSAKAMSWLVPFEFKRLLLTNEITKDAENKNRINGNVLKKLSSGGDKIEGRVNHKDEINFKIQSRVCMFCNDLPPIEPSDAKETSYMFKFPSKFIDANDSRVTAPIKVRKSVVDDDGEFSYVTDEDGNQVYRTLTQFYAKDDNIKVWSQKPEVLDAFIEIIFDNYFSKVPIPESMKEEQEDFKEEDTDEMKFNNLFTFETDPEYRVDDSSIDWLSVDVINIILRKNKINLSPQKYKSLLLKNGCVKCKKTKNDGKRVLSWVNIQIYDGVEDDLAQAGCLVDDEDE